MIKLIDNGDISDTIGFKHRGRYYHEKSYVCDEIEILSNDRDTFLLFCEGELPIKIDQLENIIKEWYEGACRRLYKSLEEHYDFLTTDEQVYESLKANDYEFDEQGNII